MASSVSKIAVQFTGDTTSLTAAAQNASRAVQQMQRGVGGGLQNVTMLAQQGVFAVDDFMAQWTNQGVAAGLRGAANNLTVMASAMGGLQVQLLAIAGISLAQLGLNAWTRNEKQALDEARESASKFRKEMDDVRASVERVVSMNRERREIAGITERGGLLNRHESNQSAMADLRGREAGLQAVLNRISPEMTQLQFKDNRTDADEERLKVLKEEVETTSRLLDQAQAEHRERQAMTTDLQKQLDTIKKLEAADFEQFKDSRRLKMAMEENANRIKRRDELKEVNEDLAALKSRGAMSTSELWTKFPQALQAGSVGAVSALTTSQYGPQNIQSSMLKELQESNRTQKRIEELERKKSQLEIVPGP